MRSTTVFRGVGAGPMELSLCGVYRDAAAAVADTCVRREYVICGSEGCTVSSAKELEFVAEAPGSCVIVLRRRVD